MTSVTGCMTRTVPVGRPASRNPHTAPTEEGPESRRCFSADNHSYRHSRRARPGSGGRGARGRRFGPVAGSRGLRRTAGSGRGRPESDRSRFVPTWAHRTLLAGGTAARGPGVSGGTSDSGVAIRHGDATRRRGRPRRVVDRSCGARADDTTESGQLGRAAGGAVDPAPADPYRPMWRRYGL